MQRRVPGVCAVVAREVVARLGSKRPTDQSKRTKHLQAVPECPSSVETAGNALTSMLPVSSPTGSCAPSGSGWARRPSRSQSCAARAAARAARATRTRCLFFSRQGEGNLRFFRFPPSSVRKRYCSLQPTVYRSADGQHRVAPEEPQHTPAKRKASSSQVLLWKAYRMEPPPGLEGYRPAGGFTDGDGRPVLWEHPETGEVTESARAHSS